MIDTRSLLCGRRKLTVRNIGQYLDQGGSLHSSFRTLTQLTALEVMSMLPSAALTNLVGLSNLRLLHLEVDDRDRQPCILPFQTDQLTYLKIEGIAAVLLTTFAASLAACRRQAVRALLRIEAVDDLDSCGLSVSPACYNVISIYHWQGQEQEFHTLHISRVSQYLLFDRAW